MSNRQLKALEGRKSIVESRGTPGNYFIVGEMDEANKTHLFSRAKSAIFIIATASQNTLPLHCVLYCFHFPTTPLSLHIINHSTNKMN